MLLSAANGFSTILAGQELKQPDYAIVVSETTGLLTRTPSLNKEQLDFYYEHNDWQRHCSDHLFPTEKALLDEFLKRLPSNAKVLDLGCGDGRFLEALPKSCHKFGTELSSGAARQATARGVTIVEYADVLDGVHGEFDAVVMIDLFEHLSDPLQFISSILPVIKSGGLLGIATGNGDFSVVRQDPANHWYFRVISHLCMWTDEFALRLEEVVPVQRVAQRFCSHYPFRMKEAVIERCQEFAYDLFHTARWRWLGMLASCVPVVRRARRWSLRPSSRMRRDHVVTVFRVAHPSSSLV